MIWVKYWNFSTNDSQLLEVTEGAKLSTMSCRRTFDVKFFTSRALSHESPTNIRRKQHQNTQNAVGNNDDGNPPIFEWSEHCERSRYKRFSQVPMSDDSVERKYKQEGH